MKLQETKNFLYITGTFCLIQVFEKGSSGLQIIQSKIFFSWRQVSVIPRSNWRQVSLYLD